MKKNSRNVLFVKSKGFTLIELMITVAIIAILAAIALPQYQDSVRKGRRVDAKNAVLDLAAREERFFAINNIYSVSGMALGYTGAFPVAINAGGGSFYNLSVSQTATNNFLITAVPIGDQQKDPCYTFAINHLGTQTTLNAQETETSVQGCW